MSYDENDAAWDALCERIGAEAINEFTRDRLRGFYIDHEVIMIPALNMLNEATTLLTNGHDAAAVIFFASSVELFLRSSVATPKPAICGHFKTGHRTDVRDKVFYIFNHH
jgi:hypothetical protein